MSAQAQAAKDMKIGDWESTPVVIKTGGTPDDPPQSDPTTTPCIISVDGQVFRSTLRDDIWQSAMSVQTGRITGLEINETGKPPQQINADPSELVMVQITYGNQTLTIQELPQLRDSEVTNLMLSSIEPFKVVLGEFDTWTESRAEVPADAPFVVFTRDGRPETIPLSTIDVEFQLNVDWDKIG